MKSSYLHFAAILFFLFLLGSCGSPDYESNTSDPGNMPDVITNKSFDFSTYRQVKLTIKDAEKYTRYDIYTYAKDSYLAGDETYLNESNQTVTEPVYRNEILNGLLFSGVPLDGVLVQTINVPKYCTELYIRRKNNLNFSSSIAPIINDEAGFTFNKSVTNKSSFVTQVTTYLYCVNNAAELFQVDPVSGKLTHLSNMPMGSVTCAVDQANKVVYSIGNKSPYPLMKYSISNNLWSTVKNLGMSGPRLDFNTRDGLLYFSNLDKIYTINPATGALSAARTIKGLDDTSGGDLAFANDGTLYLCTFSGLYRLQLDQANVYQSTRVSADNLPFQPTSMTFDSKEELWLANNASSSDLIVMDTQTGGWKYMYGISAKNNTDYKRSIHDLSTFRVFSTIDTIVDSDGDGIQDQDDAFPLDAAIAFELFTPSKYGTGTIAFEDLWPSYGDYDFNDVALNYQAIVKLNSSNLAVQLDLICRVKANGAGFTNGIGIELDNLSPSQIQSVVGSVFTENYIAVNSNGTEANQQHAVVILTDAARNLTSQHTISIKFTQPISTTDLGAVPFNPFIIVNKERKKEVHLPYFKPTSLGNNHLQIAGANRDSKGNYVSDKGMPWALSFIHDFKVPKEKIYVYDAYNYFIQWANSGGTKYPDWYKDSANNRNADKIQN